jgi:Domain of unknown function (DUF5916)/Carbohydrate family 9 binding domain-like
MRLDVLRASAALAFSAASSAGAKAQGVFPPPAQPPTIEARRATGPIVVDGRLDDAAWAAAMPANGFRQSEPRQGATAVFATTVRVLFDDAFIYIGALLHDTAGRKGVRVPDLRRDFGDTDADLFGVMFDTFRDGRTAVAFATNPYGAQRDLQSFDDQGRLLDVNWDAMWRVRTTVTDSGWTAEMAIPWSTLRYPAGAADWGINFVRVARRANELSGWSPWPRAYSGLRMRYAGRIRGLEPPPPATNLRVQPYGLLRAERREAGATATDRTKPDVGGDLKWAMTPNSVLDATVNTDFAQAEADIQQVNLGRFSLFFPEKRQFFLENGSLLTIGGGGFGGEPFFSRRIGLDDAGLPVAIDAGLRLTNRSAGRSAGLLGVRQRGTAGEPASTFGVGRYVQNFGAENRIGAMVVSRIDDGSRSVARSTNTVAVLDGFVRPTRSSYVRAMVARSFTDGPGGDGVHVYAHAAMNQNYGYFGWIQSYISERYEARAGFVPRGNLILTSPAVALDLRPAWRPRWIRAFSPGFSTAVYHRASDGRFQEGNVYIYPAAVTFRDGGYVRLWVQPERQDLETEFVPFVGMPIGPGRYDFAQYGVTYKPDLSRKLWAWVTVASGGYFDGRRDKAIVRIRTAPSPRVALTFDYEGNRLRDVGVNRAGETTHLFYPEARFALNPRVQLVGLWQYSSVSELASWNARIAWEFRPLSYLYLVYNDRGYRGPDSPALPTERQLILKVSYLSQL